ncbi:MAG: hypothetical protein HPM95_18115 [Alphaproteobacteria bacterium]|nr:hypothetical protein [Alphaproteobacteria bacterium]
MSDAQGSRETAGPRERKRRQPAAFRLDDTRLSMDEDLPADAGADLDGDTAVAPFRPGQARAGGAGLPSASAAWPRSRSACRSTR